MTNEERFQLAMEQVIGKEKNFRGIGTYGEKGLHSILKYYFEPDDSLHEIPVNGFIADIQNQHGIFEIQTRNFDKLRKKAAVFLDQGPLTIVYPILHQKWLCWIDEQTGSVSPKRKSPKTGTVYDAAKELYKIKPLLAHPNLTLCLIFLDAVEYRLLNGWSADKKKGSTRSQIVPSAFCRTVFFNTPDEYRNVFIPAEISKPFTAKEFAKATRASINQARLLMNCLTSIGSIQKIGKCGREYLYQ